MIPYGRQEITQADIDAVVRVLRSDFLTQGPMVPRFEKTVAAHVGARHALAVNSATSALHIACLALGLGSGDRLWTTPITFVASANCGLYCGADVDFVDIDPDTYNLCPEALARKLEQAEREGGLPKVVVPVHLCGQPCNMAAIHALAQRYGFKIIEDASHAIGGKYRGEFIGNCRNSDITVFSFHPVKIITTAEGGIALTNSNELVSKMALLRSHGITRDPAQMTSESDGPWYYQQIDLGFNYRMTELQAALGISQMERLDRYVARRHELARRYNQLLADLPVTPPWQHPDSYSALHLYVIRLQLDKMSKTHKQVFEALRADGIGVNLHYIPIHTQPYYARMGFKIGDFPQSEQYYTEAISLPMFQAMTNAQQDEVITAVRKGRVNLKLALGTVQFGMAYGIANASGRVSKEEADRILGLARSAGIDTLDTAIAYGDSEATIGQIGIPHWRVVSKLPAVPEDCTDIHRWVKSQTQDSLRRLRINRLHGLLLHHPRQLLEHCGPDLLAALEGLKTDGLVQKIGVSVYGPEELGPLFDLTTFDIVQAPLSILDRRLLDSGWAALLNQAGVELHTRSVFLQGLLLMPPQKRPEKFNRWESVWQEWARWLTDEGLTPLDACLRYPLSLGEVDRVLIGVDSTTQLQEILTASTGSLTGLPDFGQTADAKLLNPGLWSQI